MADSIRLTRQELYDRMWTTPAWKLGPELGMSGRGLAKLCLREGIPVPNRGYWAKKEFGWSPTQAKLPARMAGQSESITFETRSLKLGETLGRPLVEIPETLNDPHPLVLATLKALKRAKQQENRLVMVEGPSVISTNVSRGSLNRAMRMMDAFVRALERQGCEIRPGMGPSKPSAIVRNSDVVACSLEEKVIRTERPLTRSQAREKERNPWLHSTPRYSYQPTGDLVLRLDLGLGAGRRRNWGDGKRTKLEGLLARAVEEVLWVFAAADARREREQREDQERERQLQVRLAEERKQFQQQRRIKTVEERLTLWRAAESLRGWLVAVQKAGSAGNEVRSLC